MRMHGHINVAENGLCLMNKMHRKIVKVCEGSKLGTFFYWVKNGQVFFKYTMS